MQITTLCGPDCERVSRRTCRSDLFLQKSFVIQRSGMTDRNKVKVSLALHGRSQGALFGWPPAPIFVNEELIPLWIRFGSVDLDPAEIFLVPFKIIHARNPKMAGFLRIGFRIFNRVGANDWHWEDG